ncbi:MAG TPA: VanW family protein [Chloroflexia bacterium]|nr:VanW family protein [Chloroflexia bacterium]
MATKTILTIPPGAAGRVAPVRRTWIGVVSITVAVILVGLALGSWYVHAQDQAARIAPGVTVAGLPVAGLTEAQAQALLAEQLAAVPASPVVVKGAEKSWTFAARDLGVGLDLAATAAAAHAAARNSTTGAAVAPVLTHNRAAADAALTTMATELAVSPQDARLAVDAAGVRVSAAQKGRRLDTEATWAAITAATGVLPFGAVTARLNDVPPKVADADLAAALATVHRLSDRPVTLAGRASDGEARTWTIEPAQLRTWLTITAAAQAPPTVASALDSAQVTAYLQGLMPAVNRDPQDARLRLPDYSTVSELTADVSGQRLNLATSAARLQAAAAGESRAADLALDPITATVTAAALAPLKSQLDTTMRDGLILSYGDHTYPVSGEQLSLILYVKPSAAGAALPVEITVNDDDLSRLVSKIARELNEPARNAAYRLVDNKVALAVTPLDGLRVDQDKTATAMKAALLTGQPRAIMTADPVPPAFAATDLAGQILTPDLLQADNTSFAGSSPERSWNVTLGASKLDGWLIAPGATFSTNEALGDLTLDAGFKMGWAILVQSGNATTIPAEAGGICQVVTTLFHPVFWAGLPMVERHHHSYWISTYGRKPLGMQGLDATISPPWSDFKFKNTTGNWLLIRAQVDKQNLRVELWGTNTGWRVQVDEPVITDIVRTDQKPRNETSDKLEAGRKVQVEHAQDGFTSDIHRQVFDQSGTKIDDWHAQGTYLPSHNTFVTGTGPKAAAPPP